MRTHREMGRNEPKWGDLSVGWRETTGLWNSLMRQFQPQLKIIYCYKNVSVTCSVVSSIHFRLRFSYAIITSYFSVS